MREAQKKLADFLPLIDWPRFRRRNLTHEIEVQGRGCVGIACGDEAQAVAWVLRVDRLDRKGRVRRDAEPVEVSLTIPGIGALISAALVAHAPNPSAFRSGRDFAAWLGLVPRQNSSGGKDRLGRITKQGNPYLRRLLVLGATASLRWLHKRTDPLAVWTRQLLQRRPARLVTVALANKLARIAWAIMTTGELYRREAPSIG